ncbi:MAG: hypothetical protein Q8Q50_03450 [Methylobacter sp.]|nr:hypothetical protein [Methylobacter sp.]
MQDKYAGQAGEFVNDPDTGTRIPLAEWEAKQAKAAKPKPLTKQPKEES